MPNFTEDIENNIFHALSSALDALGDIPGDQATEGQRDAYRKCIKKALNGMGLECRTAY